MPSPCAHKKSDDELQSRGPSATELQRYTNIVSREKQSQRLSSGASCHARHHLAIDAVQLHRQTSTQIAQGQRQLYIAQ